VLQKYELFIFSANELSQNTAKKQIFNNMYVDTLVIWVSACKAFSI